jgi:hypothetical protein
VGGQQRPDKTSDCVTEVAEAVLLKLRLEECGMLYQSELSFPAL